LVFVACAGPEYESGYAIEDDTRTEVVRVDQTGLQEPAGAGAVYSTEAEYQRSQQTYDRQAGQQVIQEPAAAQPAAAQEQQLQAGQQSIPLHQEQLDVSKQRVSPGQVTVRKTVTTHTVTQPVQLQRETLIIDRSGAGAAAVSAQDQQAAQQQAAKQEGQQIQESAGAAAPFQEQSFTIPLYEEQPVVSKRVIQSGQVNLRKETQMQQQNVSGEVRGEDIQIQKSGNVQIREINGQQQMQEPAGAQPSQEQKDAEMELRQQQLEQQGQLERSEPGEDNSTRGGARDLQNYDNPTDDRFDREEYQE
jgi:stress response protein YsnF